MCSAILARSIPSASGGMSSQAEYEVLAVATQKHLGKAEGKQSFVFVPSPTLNCIRYPKRRLIFSSLTSLQQQPSLLLHLLHISGMTAFYLTSRHLASSLHNRPLPRLSHRRSINTRTHTRRSTTLHITISPSGIYSLRPLESPRNLPNPFSTQQQFLFKKSVPRPSTNSHKPSQTIHSTIA